MKVDFRRLKLRIFIQVLLIGLGTAALGFFLLDFLVDGVLQKPFADAFVRFCETVLKLDNSAAISVYHHIFRANKSVWMVFGFVALMMLVFYVTMTRFVRYFRLIIDGVDRLTEPDGEPIRLPSELDFMQDKLNSVREALAQGRREALESEQKKNDLVVYLAHDLKTPLTSVIGYLSLLDEAPDMPPEQRAKYTGITLRKACRLEQLINEFFEITRFNLQTMTLERGEINLSLLLEQMTDEFYPILSARGQRASVRVPEGMTVRGDADKLARVFNNILRNASSYGDEGSEIAVEGSAQGDRVRVAFRNTGAPIPPHRLNTIFEKFYRLDAARSGNTGGAGLGLAIARQIVELHGGTIVAESGGRHTTFTVELPVEAPEIPVEFGKESLRS